MKGHELEKAMMDFLEKKYDVLVFAMHQAFHYGDGMGTNPILIMQAISAQIMGAGSGPPTDIHTPQPFRASAMALHSARVRVGMASVVMRS